MVEDEPLGSGMPRATCKDCYFHRAQLCALQLEQPCPIFRHHERGALAPPRQPRLVPRPLDEVVAQHLLAQGAAP
jgi:hypothetical protein